MLLFCICIFVYCIFQSRFQWPMKNSGLVNVWLYIYTFMVSLTTSSILMAENNALDLLQLLQLQNGNFQGSLLNSGWRMAEYPHFGQIPAPCVSMMVWPAWLINKRWATHCTLCCRHSWESWELYRTTDPLLISLWHTFPLNFWLGFCHLQHF